MFNIVKAFGIINAIMALIITLCVVFMLVVIFSGLFFIWGF